MSTLTRALRSSSRPLDRLRRRPWHEATTRAYARIPPQRLKLRAHHKRAHADGGRQTDRHPKSAQSRNANAQSRNTDKSLTPMNSLISHQNETQAPSAHAVRPIAVTHASRQGGARPLISCTLHGVAEEGDTKESQRKHIEAHRTSRRLLY